MTTNQHIQQLQQELTQARDFYYPAHWTKEQRDNHSLRIERLENELSWLKQERFNCAYES